MRTLVAAAVQKGDTIRFSEQEVTVAKVHNSTPSAGRITWEDKQGNEYEIGAAVRVEVVKL